MANISAELAAIMSAIYGRDVRGSIHDAIDKINKVSEVTLSAGTQFVKNDPVPSSIYFNNTFYFNTSTNDLLRSDGSKWVFVDNLEGDGIKSITKTATNVLVDTYTIKYTKKADTTFTVTNGKGISAITKKSTSGLTDTYQIKYTDNTTSTFTVKNGSGISSFSKTGTSGLTDTYKMEYTDGTSSTFSVDNGRGITNITGPTSVGLVDTYTVTYNDGTSSTFDVSNGKGISSITGPTTSGLTDTYKINYNDGTNKTFTVKNGKGISTITKKSTSGLVDTYEIKFNDNSTTTFTVTNGSGISSIAKKSTSGLVDTYEITYTDGTTSTFTVTNGKNGTNGTNGVGISSITKKSTSGLVDTYEIAYTNNTTTTFTVTNGKNGTNGTNGTNGIGISSITKKSTSGLVDTYEIKYTNNTTTTFTVTNGLDGNAVTGVALQATSGLTKTYRMSFSNGTHFDFDVKDGANGQGSGTVTSIATGAGMTGGTITSAGTIGLALKSTTKDANAVPAPATTAGRLYPVSLDKDGKLAVNVPWTTNAGTVTSVATGDGLTGGTITGSGTLKAKLKDYTKDSADAPSPGSTANRLYPVKLDKSGNLAVNIPWTDTNTKVTAVETDTTNADYRVLLSNSNSTSDETNTVRKDKDFIYNPSTNILTVNKVNMKVLRNYHTAASSTAGSDAGSGVSPRYTPAQWKFNLGQGLADGDIITVRVPVAGGTWGAWMSADNGSNYYPVIVNGSSRYTSQFAKDTIITLVYETSKSVSVYALAGGDSVATITSNIFRVLNYYDSNDNNRTAQTNTAITTNAEYRIILSKNANDTTETQDVRKTSNIRFNPSTADFIITQSSTGDEDKPACITLKSTNTTDDTTSQAQILVYNAGNSGANMVIRPNGNLFIGSGESPANHYGAKTKHETGENAYFDADTNMYLQANAGTIANRQGIRIGSDGTIYPCKADADTNNLISLGSSSYKFKSGYFVNINGAAVAASAGMTQAQADTGTDTTYKFITPKILHDSINSWHKKSDGTIEELTCTTVNSAYALVFTNVTTIDGKVFQPYADATDNKQVNYTAGPTYDSNAKTLTYTAVVTSANTKFRLREIAI